MEDGRSTSGDLKWRLVASFGGWEDVHHHCTMALSMDNVFRWQDERHAGKSSSHAVVESLDVTFGASSMETRGGGYHLDGRLEKC